MIKIYKLKPYSLAEGIVFGTETGHLTLPEGITLMKENAFIYNNSIISLELPSTLQTVEPYVCNGADNLSSVYFKSPEYGEVVIGSYKDSTKGAFANCNIDTIYIDCWSFKSYGNSFNNNPLKNVHISQKLRHLTYGGGLEYSNLNIYYEGTISEYFLNWRFAVSLSEIFNYDSIASLGTNTVYFNNERITKFSTKGMDVPNYRIYTRRFAYFKDLEEVDISEGVRDIYNSAFEGCSSLKTIYLGSSLYGIETKAFAGCTSLTNIIFNGTISDWNAVITLTDWNLNVPATYVQCSDGQVQL